ncbi:olfactory receptor 11A1-like [Spea bombifrons]|uniref:olfactory receptor 11A1-like n=1 Tax=Spea bombifrons TaxID=233779 RepID=UPI002349D9B5|nr:olfactory receptor 11A1-like [Spea bombifrons]
MSIYGCFAQFYFYTSSGSIECLILTVMAVDRYLAICNPLRYSSVMDSRRCSQLVASAWLAGFLVMSVITVTTCNLQFCGSNIIDHLFCDLAPMLQIASADTLVIEMEAMVIAVGLSIFPFTLIIGSYVSIFCTILRIPSDTGRKKAFSTCSSHLASVCTYFGTLFIIYLAPPHGRSMKLNKILSLLYIVVTPLFNPIIYSLRNQEIKACISSYIVFYKGETSSDF